jgi:hypothetical protein
LQSTTAARSTASYRLVFVLILLAAFWLRVANLNTMPDGLHRDEARKIERAWRIIHGYGLPLYFEDIPEPFDIIIRAGVLSAAGLTPFTARLFTVFLNVLAVAAVAAAARVLYRDHPQREAIALVAAVALAALPASVVMGRGIYRANWIPLMSMLALAALAWGWRTGKRRYYAATGAFTALTMMFYLGGLAFPVSILVIILLNALENYAAPGSKTRANRTVETSQEVSNPPPNLFRGFPIPCVARRFERLAALAAAFFVTLIPWLYLYFRIPGWLDQRTAEASTRSVSPLEDPAGFVQQVGKALQAIYLPNTYFEPRFNTFTDGFLNPALLVLAVAGLLVSLWRWRRPFSLVPVIVGVVMLLPAALSSEPARPIRLIGIFGPLALLAGLGAGEILRFTNERLTVLRPFFRPIMALLCVFTVLLTHVHIQQHFSMWPDDPATNWERMAIFYKLAYRDLLVSLGESQQPVYFPLDVLNNEFMVAWLRIGALPNTRAYAGEALPGGVVMLPITRQYDIPDYPLPMQYGLILPEAHEIVVLPPFVQSNAEALAQQIRDDGTIVRNERGMELAYRLPVDANDNPFGAVVQTDGDAAGIFDGRLELIGVGAPREVTPGDYIPVTLYWRLRERTGIDYFAIIQPVDASGEARGVSDGWISRSIYPTVMWQPGEVVAETRWLRVYPDAPAGGYHYIVGVYTPPGYNMVSVVDANGVEQGDARLHLRGPVIGMPEFTPPPEDAIHVDALFEDGIRLTDAALDPLPDALAPGETLTVTLYWQAESTPLDDYTLFLHLLDADGNLVAQQDAPPLPAFPTSTWAAGDRFVTTHTLTSPADSSAPYRLYAGLYRWPSLERLAVTQGGVEARDREVELRR